MIRITVEVLPSGEGPRKTLAVLDVSNLETGEDLSDYSVVAKYGTGAEQQFTVREHPRNTSWLALVRRVLESAAVRFGLPADLT